MAKGTSPNQVGVISPSRRNARPSKLRHVVLFRHCILLAVLLVPKIYAQDWIPATAGTLPFNLAFKKAYGETNGFTAKVQMTIVASNGVSRMLPMTLCQVGQQFRSEVRMTELPGASEARNNMLRNTGMDEVVAIYQGTPQKIFILFPKLRAYLEFPDQGALSKKMAFMDSKQITLIPLGEEVFRGHTCRKVNISEPGDPATALAWKRPDLNGFPIKIEITRRTEVTSFEAVSVDISTPAASKFELPDGYTRYESAKELLEPATRYSRARTNIPPSEP